MRIVGQLVLQQKISLDYRLELTMFKLPMQMVVQSHTEQLSNNQLRPYLCQV